MKQKDLITYGLIGLAVYFLFLKKEEKPTEDTTGDGPAVATGGSTATGSGTAESAFTDGSNTSFNDPSEFPNTSR
jgi:hypothetical protein